MAVIGTFARTPDGKYNGSIDTLTIHTKAVLLPTGEQGEKPAYRVYSGHTEIGAAWNKVSEKTGSKYISVKFDDPALPDAFYATLNEQDDGMFTLHWVRRR